MISQSSFDAIWSWKRFLIVTLKFMRHPFLPSRLLPASLLLATLAGGTALADERVLTRSISSAVLPKGGKELELWLTPRLGRQNFYARFDHRSELELGLTDALQMALYLNVTSKAVGAGLVDVPPYESLSASVSNEWKYKFLDATADAVGVALYGEVTAALDEVELEAKAIVDKRFGRLLLAVNLIGEQAFEWSGDDLEVVRVFAQTAGLSYQVTSRFSAGLEAYTRFVWEGRRFAGGALFGGPVVSYATKHGWGALSLTPQLRGFKSRATRDEPEVLELHEHERFQLRLLVGFHL
jgi:hypothetical protein